MREVAAVRRNRFVRHKVLGKVEFNCEQVNLVRSEHAVIFYAYTTTDGAMRVFVNSRGHLVVGAGYHDDEPFRETKDGMEMNFT